VKNPRNIEMKQFMLPDSPYVIYCGSSYGPTFGRNHDIHVSDGCNANNNSYTYLGGSYLNDTNIEGKQVFTGQHHFTVKEIEVFSIQD
jgi:hypothetical protein